MVPRSMCKDDAEYIQMLRDDFAAKAMAALMAEDIDDGQSTSEYIEETACGAYKYADAMLRARGAT